MTWNVSAVRTGRSRDADPDGDYSLEGWADDLLGFCDALAIEKPIVLGNSAGGMVAAVYGIRHPDHPGKLVLSSTQARLDPARCANVFERLGGESQETALDALRIGDMSSLAAYNEHCMPLYNPTPLGPPFGHSTFRQDLARACPTVTSRPCSPRRSDPRPHYRNRRRRGSASS